MQTGSKAVLILINGVASTKEKLRILRGLTNPFLTRVPFLKLRKQKRPYIVTFFLFTNAFDTVFVRTSARGRNTSYVVSILSGRLTVHSCGYPPDGIMSRTRGGQSAKWQICKRLTQSAHTLYLKYDILGLSACAFLLRPID